MLRIHHRHGNGYLRGTGTDQTQGDRITISTGTGTSQGKKITLYSTTAIQPFLHLKINLAFMGLSVKKISQTQAQKNRYGPDTDILTGNSKSATTGTEKILYKTFYTYRNLFLKHYHTKAPVSRPFQAHHNITKCPNPSITRRRALKELTGTSGNTSAIIVSKTPDIVLCALCCVICSFFFICDVVKKK